MTPADRTAPAQTQTISLEFDLHYSPEQVWRALTDPVLLTKWLLPVVDLNLEPGAVFTFDAEPQPGWQLIVHCRFIEIEMYRKLSYTWVADDLETVVTFTLTPTTSGTHLSLMHSGFKPDQKLNVAGARSGWNMMVGKLGDLLASTPYTRAD